MRFTVYLGTATLLMLPMQSTRLDAEIMVQIEGQGGGEGGATTLINLEAENQAEVNAEADAALQSEIEADAKLASMVSAQTEGIWNNMKAQFGSWSEDVQKGWTSIKMNARGTNLTTMSKLLGDTIKGMTVWQSFAHDYTDHVATSDHPLNLSDFFDQSTFYHGRGDWGTYNRIYQDLGEKPKKDGYIAQRKDSRNEMVNKKLEEMKVKVDQCMKEAKVGKKAKEYSDFATSRLPQGFYDKVAENKDNPPIPPKKPEDSVAEVDEDDEGEEEGVTITADDEGEKADKQK